jgi:acyl-coenzyme A synthetase/AMP-(fatty) acid ligase
MPEKNAQSFIQNPLNPDYPETVYLTGDLGQYNEQGELVFCGRADNQIKYMGHRIELEEIERSMAAIEGVERCICVFDEKKQRLKGFYVGSIEKNELHSIMKNTLPPFMIPGYIRQIEQIILTKNGKLDRKKTIELIGGR